MNSLSHETGLNDHLASAPLTDLNLRQISVPSIVIFRYCFLWTDTICFQCLWALTDELYMHAVYPCMMDPYKSRFREELGAFSTRGNHHLLPRQNRLCPGWLLLILGSWESSAGWGIPHFSPLLNKTTHCLKLLWFSTILIKKPYPIVYQNSHFQYTMIPLNFLDGTI